MVCPVLWLGTDEVAMAKAYFWSYAHNEFSEDQLTKWDLCPGFATYVVPDLGIFTQNPGQVDEVSDSTHESNKAGQDLLGGV